MLTSGHDVGYIGNNKPAAPTRVNHSKIYEMTHDANDRSRSYINRSYLSFSYGGKNIEEFELIATMQGTLSKSMIGDFKDLTTAYDVIDGQFYWGTYFTGNNLSLTLSTNSMTQEHLDAFINWFSPGEAKELILNEHPNRAIMARIAEPPTMDMTPFEENVTIVINGTQYTTITTLYKGNISLRFVMDSSFWYAKSNFLTTSGETAITQWTDASGTYSNIYDEDMVRILFEDRIITKEAMPHKNMELFGDRFTHRSDSNIKVINDALLKTEDRTNLQSIFDFTSGISLSNNALAYIFYGGTAPTKPIIRFTIQNNIDNNNNPYRLINAPANSVTKTKGTTTYAYNTITLTGSKTQIIKISAPNVFISYNQAQWCIANASSYQKLRELLNEKVTHYHALRWAFRAIDYMEYYNNSWSSSIRSRLQTIMYYFIYHSSYPISKYILDGNTNHAYAILGYYKAPDETNFPSGDSGWQNFGTLNTDIEDVSDIMLTDYLELNERNKLTSNGNIDAWNSSNPTLTYKISHNFAATISDVAVIFKNLYY